MINKKIEEILNRKVTLVHPKDIQHGDYTLIADVETAEADLKILKDNKPSEVERVELAGGRFINLYLSKDFYKNSLKEIIEKGDEFGKSEHAKGFKVMVEYTDANPFKELHAGHLMSNTLGESVSRIIEWNGAEVKRANYQGDAGIHIAQAVWGMKKGAENPYVFGNKAYEEDEEAKKEIIEINKKIYDKTDPEINDLYQKGREESLKKFEEIYKRLGTKFDYYFFESETASLGKKIVEENMGEIFEESEGAIVFKGDKFDSALHTRVFINSHGIPTYEAKDLGNAKNKFENYKYDLSIVMTGNEIREYFKVMLKALELIYPDLAKKTKHLPHGMLKLLSGKMSSRKGNVITAEALIDEVKTRVKDDERVAIGAIKYMILRQTIGHDIIFDFEKSVSTEGDSGVYLQYAHARANSILEKAKNVQHSVLNNLGEGEQGEVRVVEKLLYRFPEMVEKAGRDYSPNTITTYLTELASAFNNFYAHEPVLEDSPESAYRLAIVQAFKIVMKNGLTILGIPVPEKM